jgi:hypothetical protein
MRESKNICRLCLEEKELTYEHYPPKSAFNKQTQFYSIDYYDYAKNFRDYHTDGVIKSKIYQGGLGDYVLCEDCNNFLGITYVRDYVKFAKICMSILNQYEDIKGMALTLKRNEVNLKYFLKQVASIFISCNQPYFAEDNPELINFIRDKDTPVLSDRYRFYLYLNNEGQIKNGLYIFTNLYGGICEFTFAPFGIVLNIDNPNRIDNIYEMTNFKNYDNLTSDKFELLLNKYPSYTPVPLDFRSKNEVDKIFL